MFTDSSGLIPQSIGNPNDINKETSITNQSGGSNVVEPVQFMPVYRIIFKAMDLMMQMTLELIEMQMEMNA